MLPVAGGIVNIALTLSGVKGWLNRIPDWVVVCLWIGSLVPIGCWLFTHERAAQLRVWIHKRWAIHPRRVALGVGAIVILTSLTLSGAAYWTLQRIHSTAPSIGVPPPHPALAALQFALATDELRHSSGHVFPIPTPTEPEIDGVVTAPITGWAAEEVAAKNVGSTRDSEQTRDWSGFGILGLIGSREPSSLRKCGNPASFAGFPSAGGTVEKSGVGLFYGSPGASFPRRTRNYARFGANVVVACC